MIFTVADHARQIIEQLLELIAHADLVSTGVALFVFWRVGERAVASSKSLRRAGLQFGLVAFCGFLVRVWETTGIQSGAELANAAIRAVVCAGLATSAAGIVVPILSFLYDHTLAAAGQILRRQ